MVLLLTAVDGEMMVTGTAGMTESDLLLARGFNIFIADVVQTKKVFDVLRRRGRRGRDGRRVEQRKTLDRRHHMNQHETYQQIASCGSFERTSKRFHFCFVLFKCCCSFALVKRPTELTQMNRRQGTTEARQNSTSDKPRRKSRQRCSCKRSQLAIGIQWMVRVYKVTVNDEWNVK